MYFASVNLGNESRKLGGMFNETDGDPLAGYAQSWHVLQAQFLVSENFMNDRIIPKHDHVFSARMDNSSWILYANRESQRRYLRLDSAHQGHSSQWQSPFLSCSAFLRSC